MMERLTREQYRERAAAKVAAAQEVLATEVASLVTGKDWRKFLDFQAMLHDYSANNVMLIFAASMREPTRKVEFRSRRRRISQDSRHGGPSAAPSNVDNTVTPVWHPCEGHAGWLVMPRAMCGRCAKGTSRVSVRPRRERR